jgi:hypothetical protein
MNTINNQYDNHWCSLLHELEIDTNIEDLQIAQYLFSCLSKHLKCTFLVFIHNNDYVRFLIAFLLSEKLTWLFASKWRVIFARMHDVLS